MNTITFEEATKLFEVNSKWKHFKGYILTIVAVAKHTETDEILIIYNCENPNDSSYKYRIEDFIKSNEQFDKKTNYFRYNYSDIWNNFNNFKQAFVENAKDVEVINFLDYTIQCISDCNLDKFLTKDDICFLTEYIPIYTSNLRKINELYETEIQPYIVEHYDDIKKGLI